ncbi:unnamed protein product [Acanthoscelides obtectus]|uniref:Trichohyalin-plectin-homology domain-containing protein n=1 Tax=Acanthoscelides obtectus TaxID=200917 RepID=A0A9P0Q451_ACAOB|nr:unnamed protein product [Acanthoscelides obtectus]CAK1662625.1 hypothetical protein AOBTE_LOCUS23243 [Acanthoscelides obtectus]
MESRWYLFPGQTLENTKISERSHALHITQTEWGKITGHLDRNRLIQEAIDREATHKRYLDDGSKSMIKNWENSLENIRKRKEEERSRLIEQRKGDRMARFYELRREQERIRNEYVAKVKHDIYIDSGNARQLTGAYVEAEAMYERERQTELQKKIKQHEAQEEAKWAQKVKEGAEEEAKGKQEGAEKEKVRKAEFSKKLLDQIEENAREKAAEREKQIEKENIDLIKAQREQDCLKKLEILERKKKTENLKKERQKQIEDIRKRRIQAEQKQKELDEVIQIYKEAKFNIDCMKKAREKELRDQQVARRDAIAKKVMAIKESNEAAEEAAIKEAIAERDATEEAQRRAKQEKLEKMRKERLEDRQKFIEKEKHRQYEEDELKKWGMLNRYKVDEVMKKYDEQKKKAHWKKILAYRKTLLDQMAQNKAEIERLKKFDSRIEEPTEDAQFFEYADEVLELAQKGGFPTHPIERVILDYKKRFNLIPEQLIECEEYGTKKCKNNEKVSPVKELLKKSVKKQMCRCRCDSRTIKK